MYVIGIDLGGSSLKAAACDRTGRILQRTRRKTPRREGKSAVVAAIADAAHELQRPDGPPEAIGIGVPGVLRPDDGTVVRLPNFPGWDGFPLAERLASELGVPCSVDNDATTAGVGEFVALGEPEGLHLVAMTIGTGIGGAIFVDGKLHRGRLGTAAEFGHMTVDRAGAVCWCGNRGCMHTLASGSAERSATRA